MSPSTGRSSMRTALMWGGLVVVVGISAAVARDALASRTGSQIAALEGLQIEYLVDADQAARLDGSFGDDFTVTSTGVTLFRSGARLLRAAPGSRPTVVRLKGAAPTSFAADVNDALLTVAGGFFGVLDADGRASESVPLPFDGMRLASSSLAGSVALYGGHSPAFHIYRFADNGAFQILLDLDEPIVGVADNAKAVYVATLRQLFRFDGGRPALLLTARPEDLDGGIVSVAVSASDEVVLFSTRSRIFAWRDGAAVSIVNDSGGSLRLRGDRLYVVDAVRRLVYAASPISQVFTGAGR